MVDEIYRNPLIASANENLVDQVSLRQLLSVLGKRASGGGKGLRTAAAGSQTPFPFFEDASVNSQRVQQLNADPFNDDVAYAAVVGTQSIIGGMFAEWTNLQFYRLLQPMFGTASYFPWLYKFDGPGKTDAIVPTWSAALGVPDYNFLVGANHVSLIQNGQVQQQALEWLNDPNVPLGSAQRSAWAGAGSNQPPISQWNAYQGALPDPVTGSMSGGGLTPDPIVNVEMPGGPSATVWGTGVDDVGIKHPTLTGMIRYGDIGTTSFILQAADGLNAGGIHTLQNLGPLPQAALNIDPAQVVGAGPNDWVAYSVKTASAGRRHDRVLTGPDGHGIEGSPAFLTYAMSDLPDGIAPPLPITLPVFVLAQPTHTGLSVIVSGAVEVDSSWIAQSNEVDIKDERTGLKIDHIIVSVSHAPDSIGAIPWDGLLMPYTGAVQLQREANGDVYGQDNNTGIPDPQLYQLLNERWGVPDPKSLAVGI